MKKYFLAALLALSMSAFAQHVTPLSIELTEFKLDSLRTLYLAEPPMYRAALNMVAQSLDMDAAAVNEAKTQLKVERAHSKQIATSIKEATKMTNELRKLYGKEESELKSMQKSVVRQQETINRQMEFRPGDIHPERSDRTPDFQPRDRGESQRLDIDRDRTQTTSGSRQSRTENG